MTGQNASEGVVSEVVLAEAVQYTLHRSGRRAAFQMLAIDTAGCERLNAGTPIPEYQGGKRIYSLLSAAL